MTPEKSSRLAFPKADSSDLKASHRVPFQFSDKSNENQWLTEPSLIKSKKLPRELLSYLDQQYGTKQGVRQRLIGE